MLRTLMRHRRTSIFFETWGDAGFFCALCFWASGLVAAWVDCCFCWDRFCPPGVDFCFRRDRFCTFVATL